jgi:hypothetical protein
MKNEAPPSPDEIREILKPGYFRKRLTIESIMAREDWKRNRRAIDAAYRKTGCNTRFKRIK